MAQRFFYKFVGTKSKVVRSTFYILPVYILTFYVLSSEFLRSMFCESQLFAKNLNSLLQISNLFYKSLISATSPNLIKVLTVARNAFLTNSPFGTKCINVEKKCINVEKKCINVEN